MHGQSEPDPPYSQEGQPGRGPAALRGSTRVVILTGAGISAESGVPTFRGQGGLWRSYRAEDLATPQAFRRDPALVWQWYAWRRSIIGACVPNAAHQALADMEQALDELIVVTQNVDGLHGLAGSRRVLELHGTSGGSAALQSAARPGRTGVTRCPRSHPIARRVAPWPAPTSSGSGRRCPAQC